MQRLWPERSLKSRIIKRPKATPMYRLRLIMEKQLLWPRTYPFLGAAYQLTKDEKYARYVALALDKWANAVPDFFMTEGWNKDPDCE